MEFEVGSSIRVKNPDGRFKEFLTKNLIVNNMEYVQKKKLGFYVGNIPKKVYLFSVDGKDCIIPYGALETLTSTFPDVPITSTFKEQKKVNFELKDMGLEDYQRKAVREMSKHYAGILQSRAGSGKTNMGIALAGKLGKKTLWIAHTKDLVKQAYERACLFMPREKCGLTVDGKVQIGECITFATIQTMVATNLLEYVDTFDTLIIDECHRISRNSTRLKMYERLMSSLRCRHKFGLSATPKKTDGSWQSTFIVMGDVLHKVPDSAVAKRVMQTTIVPILTPFKEVYFLPDGLIDHHKTCKAREENAERNDIIKQIIENQKSHSILVLFDTIRHINSIYESLPEDIKSKTAIIHGHMVSAKEKKLRVEYLEQMRTGEKKYLLCTYALAKEGLDIPRLDRLILAVPHTSETVLIQSIGRISRVFEDKKDAVVFDLVDPSNKIAFTKGRMRIYRKENCAFKTVDEVWEE